MKAYRHLVRIASYPRGVEVTLIARYDAASEEVAHTLHLLHPGKRFERLHRRGTFFANCSPFLDTQATGNHRSTQPCLRFGLELKQRAEFEALVVSPCRAQKRGVDSFSAHLPVVELPYHFLE